MEALNSQTTGVLRTTDFMIMTVYAKHGKTSFEEKNRGQKLKVNDWDSQSLKPKSMKELQLLKL